MCYTRLAIDACADSLASNYVTISVNQPSTAAGSISPSASPVCQGSSTTLSPNGGALGTNAHWEWYSTPGSVAGACGSGTDLGAGNTKTVTPTAQTTYSVRAIGPGTCTNDPTSCASLTINVEDSATVPTNITGDSVLCAGGNTTLTVHGGSLGGAPNANYQWYSGSCNGTPVGSGIFVNISNLTATTVYYANISGSCNTTHCVFDTVKVNPLPQGSISGTTSVCASATNAVLTFNFTSGKSPYNIIYFDGVNPHTVNGVVNGQTLNVSPGSTTSYTFQQITDANGCVRTNGFGGGATVTVTPLPSITSVSATNVLCNGGSTGTITVSASGGTGTLYYSDNNGTSYQTGNDLFTGLDSGAYNIVIHDAQNCSATYVSNPVVIGQPTALIQKDSTVKASCLGVNDGQIFVTASGGISPYHYALNGGPVQSSSNFTGISAGNYAVDVFDANGCENIANVVISNSYIIHDTILAQSNVSCFGGSNGSVTVQLSGGTPAYSYSINGIFQPSPIFSGLTAGNYVVTLQDSKGCTDYLPVTIKQPTQVGVVIDSIVDISCSGGANGAIFVHDTGGTPGYTFHWSNGETTQNDINLTAAIYSLNTVRRE